MGPDDRPHDWKGLKASVPGQYGECGVGHAIERLRKVQQTGTVRDYLARLENAVAESVPT